MKQFTAKQAILIISTWLLIVGSVTPAEAIVLPPQFVQTRIAGGLRSPTAMTIAPDGRIFVAQQAGALRIIENNVLLTTPFISLTVNSAGERGLLGITFDPEFETNNHLYLYYTTSTTPRRNRVSRFTANGNVAVPGSESIIFETDVLSSNTNHNGGTLAFGADGKLYIAVGENVVPSNAQSFNNVMGKILRINKDGSIPEDNPFYTTATGKNRAIWALGLRNPFNFAFRRGTSTLYINDVGQSTWEEINVGAAGANYGWPVTEGPTTNPAYRSPLYAYNHFTSPEPVCAITAGVFYNPPTLQFPAVYHNDYFFADYCASFIKHINLGGNVPSTFATATYPNIVDLEVDSFGSLYYLSRGTSANDGVVYRITYTEPKPPTITLNPQNQRLAKGESATFTCEADGLPAPAYQWRRNGTDIPGATRATYTLKPALVGDNGAQFRCVATNLAGTVTSLAATLTVIDGVRPQPVILTPAAGTTFIAGQEVAFSGAASDGDQGTLPASAFTWEVLLHHDAHNHPFVAPFSGERDSSFTPATFSHQSVNIWYRIYLTVEDNTGLTTTTFRDVRPQVVRATVASQPRGLQINVDGTPRTTPYSIPEVVGVEWEVEAPSPQIVGSTRWDYESWSDGGAQTHFLTITSGAPVYTAVYFGCPVIPDPSPPGVTPTRNYFTTATVTLEWNRVSWATGYQIQVDNTPDFARPEFESGDLAGDVYAITTEPLRNCTYYWRARAQRADGTWGNWSAADKFVVIAP